MAALCASRWSAIGCIDGGTKNLSMKERPKANCASRWSAVGRMVGTTKKNGLTGAGLLMEVARDSPGVDSTTLLDRDSTAVAVAKGISRQISWLNALPREERQNLIRA